ncbi:MAG: hypothetical protein P1V20_16305 [Verrucomicrobiales bacterium]|nr:hypothetical protein [Verrucomicrobiales bacterium]
MFFNYSYATPSAFESTREHNSVDLAANERRPVRFHGKVKSSPFLIRVVLRALGEVIWSNHNYESWMNSVLDPVITVHPDRIFFEAFSQDQSAYAQVRLNPALFEPQGKITCGTTNIDFTAWLWAALAEMRSSRETWFRIDSGGFEIRTQDAGGRFEQKVEIPDSWVRGFLALQDAMAMPGTRLHCRPVDILAAIRYLKYGKSRLSPKALRYEFEPGEDAKIVLEPWEQEIPLKGTAHNYGESHRFRVWGRRRLRLLEPVLPFADSVDVYLKGRALPSFYVVSLPGIQFILGLSGWSAAEWSKPGGLSLTGAKGKPSAEIEKRTWDIIRKQTTVSARDLAKSLGCELPEANDALRYLCREGRAIYDLDTRKFRHRELFEDTPDLEKLFPPDLRSEKAEKFIADNLVEIQQCFIEEMKKVKKLHTPDGPVRREIVYRDWKVEGRAGDEESVMIKISDHGKIIFGTCGCAFFRDNILNQGPCEHMLALFEASSAQRVDRPVSTDAGDSRPPVINYELDEDHYDEEE